MTFELPVLAPGPKEFAFACNRCGNCCTNASGYVWVSDAEVPRLAAAMGMEERAFARRHLRKVGDRLSLVEEGGRCSLLLGKNECGAYAARPEQCRTYPFWPEITAGGEAYAAAKSVCPGILEAPPRDARHRAYAALADFYRRADLAIGALQPRCEMSGECCDFPKAGHRLFATLLEVDYAAEKGPEARGTAGHPEWCAFWIGRRCTAREVRPLACRTYYCDVTTTAPLLDLHETLLAELRALARAHAYPEGYGDFVELLPARRAAIELLDRARGAAAEVSQ